MKTYSITTCSMFRDRHGYGDGRDCEVVFTSASEEDAKAEFARLCAVRRNDSKLSHGGLITINTDITLDVTETDDEELVPKVGQRDADIPMDCTTNLNVWESHLPGADKVLLNQLSDWEVENGLLADLAKHAGYASLKAMANDLKMWNATTDEVQKFLLDQLNTYR